MTIGRIALLFCAAIWCACGAFALAALVGRARRAMRRYGVSARVVFLLAAAACVMLAGGKGGSVAVHDDYIADAGSYLTNDVAHVALSKKTPNLPDSTEILVYARELSSTNAADWFRLAPHLTFADHPYDYSLPNATNYSVLVSSSFVPEPTVHTNGVWALRGFEIPGHPGKYAFGNSRVRKIVTASDYVQDGLIAMWDGIENAGWGVHGANAPIDLVGSADLTSIGKTIIEADNFTAGIGTYFKASVPTFATAVKNKNFTLQIIVKNSRGSNSAICGIGNRGVWLYGSSIYNVSTLNILASWHTQTPSINFYSDTKFSISILGGVVPKIRLNDSEVQAIYGSLTNVSPTDLLLGALNATFTGGNASFYSVRAYSRILTSEEIQHNYEIDRRRFNLP